MKENIDQTFVISMQMKATGKWVVLGLKQNRIEAEQEGQRMLSKMPIFKSFKVEQTEYSSQNSHFINSEVIGITPKEVRNKLKLQKNIQFIDVREANEIKKDQIPGSILIEVKDIPHKLGELERNKEYIVYCTAGYRSPYVCKFLMEKGYKAFDLKGGLLAWKGAGFVTPVIEGALHVWNKLKK